MGVFTNAISGVSGWASPGAPAKTRGLARWLLDRLHRRSVEKSRLVLVERITLAPRQMLALVEADGQRLLLATSAEGTPVFYPLRGAATRRAARSERGAKGTDA